MIKRDWELLFSDQRLDVVLSQQLVAARGEVRAITEQQFVTDTNELLIASVVSRFAVRPLEIVEGIEVSPQEAKVDVSHDPNRHFSTPGPHYVDGLEVTYHVPYWGSPGLWKCQPNHYTSIPPTGGGGGVMEAASRAFFEVAARSGLVIGILLAADASWG